MCQQISPIIQVQVLSRTILAATALAICYVMDMLQTANIPGVVRQNNKRCNTKLKKTFPKKDLAQLF